MLVRAGVGGSLRVEPSSMERPDGGRTLCFLATDEHRLEFEFTDEHGYLINTDGFCRLRAARIICVHLESVSFCETK